MRLIHTESQFVFRPRGIPVKQPVVRAMSPVPVQSQCIRSAPSSEHDFVIQLLEACAKVHSGPSLHHPGSGFNDGGPSCGMHWIHCLLPVINAGLCQLTADVTASSNTGQSQPAATLALGPDVRALAPGNLMASPARICVNLIRAQLRGLNLVAVLHAARSGYADRVSLNEFRRHYESLMTSSVRESIVSSGDGEISDKQIFLRSYVLPQLQLRRSSVKSIAPKGDNSICSPLHLDTTKNTTVTLVASPRGTTINNTTTSTSTIPANKNLQQYLDAKAKAPQTVHEFRIESMSSSRLDASPPRQQRIPVQSAENASVPNVPNRFPYYWLNFHVLFFDLETFGKHDPYTDGDYNAAVNGESEVSTESYLNLRDKIVSKKQRYPKQESGLVVKHYSTILGQFYLIKEQGTPSTLDKVRANKRRMNMLDPR
ncbi:unnamed protein product [Echinostoma caproni]|uniref:Exonuclease domain-containing protein n=1 Tax=Echinostoma caproni TaxID=27848 RepID=A0A183AIW2_9TREM|nr:unnamed protein product [Echinostoma caproni]